MKCISCGAEIGLTDSKCPYCGREITENARHRMDLNNYKEANQKVKSKADSIISSNLPLVISTVVMILLIIAVIIASYVEDNAYTFRSEARYKESVKKYDDYIQTIHEYLDAGDYTGFYAFMEYHNIREFEEPYADLKLLKELSYYYERMVKGVEEAVLYGPEAKIYNQEDYIRTCARNITSFYDEYKYNDYEIEDDPYKDYIYDMRDKADLILEVYFGLDEAGRAEFLEGSDNVRYAYIEEVILGE